MQANVASKEAVKDLVNKTIEKFGRVDILVNNAGVAPSERRDILDATEESFERLLRINLQGPYFLTRRVARYWTESGAEPVIPGGFKIVFVTSISADTVSLNRGEYCVSKAGLAMAFKLLLGAQKRWRKITAPHLVALVQAGVKFPDGQRQLSLKVA